MAGEYLDKAGLTYFWGKIKDYIATHSGGGITLNDVYPVGSIYMSVNSTSPATLFGGTWTRIQGRFLLAASDTTQDYAPGNTGGEAKHTLTEAELPSISSAFEVRHWQSGDIICNPTGKFTSNGTGGALGNGVNGNSTTANMQKITYAFGSGNAHNNMPPYLAVYVWKRTA